MSDTVIRVENISKKYILNHQYEGRKYKALRDVIANGAKSISKKLLNNYEKGKFKQNHEEFWALKDIYFEIKQGDRVGIIGRNGAGKSTLLKILSRITEPTSGRISIKGRVASLLEVGTGFHPELTGRENIYLNGAILGMSKVEIKRKFDEIVDFAEVEKFLDTPVKRFSSGMYVRLAFAVAAHLEPEILIVDEVLAVGDIQFQKKCLGKMDDVGKEGRTVLFVSHQMSTIEKLCSQTIMLNLGSIQYIGDTKSAINLYLRDLETQAKDVKISELNRSGTGDIRITNFSLEDSLGNLLMSAASGEDLVLVFHYRMLRDKLIKNVSVGFSLHNLSGERISLLYSDYVGTTFSDIPEIGKFKCKIKDLPYANGRYFVAVRILANGIEADWPRDFIGCIDVDAGDFYRTGISGHSGTGTLLIRGDWQVEAT
ncbi:ATP-binding cassette domain-containing protein [aff. Roholtiella sp. LEGE 12411]|uniref:ATP-binding cassette domain-containing protein n=1 Tax=aff. Roholtiella sp. LEGE 12411 TaxID=1828822 RepID=UPI0018803CFA|nr:ABC transporter ATP-binding protein [aff. Roholtiella sp. LEGE 12411]